MKRTISVVLAGASALALACGGSNNSNRTTTDSQYPEARTGASTNMPDRNSQSASDSRATLTGCLTTGEQPGTYVLQMAAVSDTSGSSQSASSASANLGGRSYRVIPENGYNLTQDVNKRVAIDGYVENGAGSSMGSSGTSGSVGTSGVNGGNSSDRTSADQRSGSAGATAGSSGSTAGATGDATSGMSMPTLRASSVRRVADTCTAGESNSAQTK